MKRALLFSALLHAGLILPWLLRGRAPVSLPQSEKLEFEVQQAKREATGDSRTGTHKGRKRGGAGRRDADANRLGAQFGAGTLRQALNGGARGAGKNLTDEGELGFLEQDWGSHGGRLGEIENFNKYEKFFAHLEGMVNYPGKLGIHGIEDHINSRIVFDGNSRCDWSRSRVEGANPYFRVYALALLKKLCGLETIEHIGFSNGQFVDISLDFEIIGVAQERPPPDLIQGNVLMIRRTFFKPKMQVHAGPFEWSPIAPGMVYLDFPWIFEHWDKWVEGKDPLAEFKGR